VKLEGFVCHDQDSRWISPEHESDSLLLSESVLFQFLARIYLQITSVTMTHPLGPSVRQSDSGLH